jgi:HlyD family secretion protein
MNKIYHYSLWTPSLLCLLVTLVVVRAEDKKDEEIKPPETHEVKRGSLKVKVQLDGVFESAEMYPIRIRPKVWTDLTVVEPTQHGATVKKNDPLVKFETEKLVEQISDLEQDRPGSKLALELAEAELKNLKETTSTKLEGARNANRIATEEYDYFQTTSREQREKGSLFSLTNSLQRLESAAEELKQLESMYKADHLTEETEEIILKRQRFAVEAAQFSLNAVKLNVDRDLKVNIPREHERLRLAKREQELSLALSEETFPRSVPKKEADVAKLKRDDKKNVKKLEELKQDLKALEVTAPADGIVYYGACQNGKWITAAEVARKLVPGGKLAPNEIIMTVVNPEKLLVKTIVPETELQHLTTGVKGEIAPAAAPDKKLPVKIKELGFVPLPGGGFEAQLSLEDRDGTRLVPGMTGRVTFEAEKKNILSVPRSAVFTENNDKVIYVATTEGKSAKRVVKTGGSDEGVIELLEGVTEGDRVLLKKPE